MLNTKSYGFIFFIAAHIILTNTSSFSLSFVKLLNLLYLNYFLSKIVVLPIPTSKRCWEDVCKVLL